MKEIWLRIQAFFDILSSRNVLVEVGVLAVCLLIGALVGAELSRRNQRQRTGAPISLSWRYFATQGNVVVTPIIVLPLVSNVMVVTIGMSGDAWRTPSIAARTCSRLPIADTREAISAGSSRSARRNISA